MNRKKIVVTLKYYQGELNPFDGAALECALQTGGDVTAVAMAPESGAVIRSRVCGKRYAGDELYFRFGDQTVATRFYFLRQAKRRRRHGAGAAHAGAKAGISVDNARARSKREQILHAGRLARRIFARNGVHV